MREPLISCSMCCVHWRKEAAELLGSEFDLLIEWLNPQCRGRGLMEVWKWAGRVQGRRKRRQELWLSHLLSCAYHWPKREWVQAFVRNSQAVVTMPKTSEHSWPHVVDLRTRSASRAVLGENLCHVLVRTSPKAAHPFPRVGLFNFFTSTHAHKHTHSRAHAHTHTHFSQHSCLWHLISRDNEQAALI